MNDKERKLAAKESRKMEAIGECVAYGLEWAIEAQGAQLTGLSVVFRGYEVLIVVKAIFEGKKMVAFVSSGDMGTAMRKTEGEARNNKLRWKEDEWNPEVDKNSK